MPSMPIRFEPLPGLSVTVDRVLYEPDRPAQPDRPYFFSYYLSIHNASKVPVTIFGRKWILADDDGSTLVVEGDGVVGQKPRLEPGTKFTYNSAHTIRNGSTAIGTFFGRTDSGQPVHVRVPNFRMEVPG